MHVSSCSTLCYINMSSYRHIVTAKYVKSMLLLLLLLLVEPVLITGTVDVELLCLLYTGAHHDE